MNLDILDYSGITLLSLATENYDKLIVSLLQARETTTPQCRRAALRSIPRSPAFERIYLPLLQHNYGIYTYPEARNENKTNVKRGKIL